MLNMVKLRQLRRGRAVRGVAAVCIAAMCVAMNGCGYSLAGRGSFLPAYIKTIGVPTFGNSTPIFEIERRVTERVRAELVGRGRYTVLTETTGVDAVLSGEILAINLAPAAFNQQQQATAYTLTLVAKVEFRDLKSDKVLWHNPAMVFSEQYPVQSTTAIDANTFLGQNVNALERLSSEFARTVVSAILEAF
jgi:Lipopolysaccharide-assembly